MSIRSNISAAIARQVGRMQGALVTRVETSVLGILLKFSNKCPSPQELVSIIATKNNLLKSINSLESRINRFKSLANKLDRSISTIRRIISIIKSIPTPTAVIPPGSPGGLGIPIRILTSYSDGLIRLNKLLDSLESDKEGILSIVSTTSQTISELKNRITAIDISIAKCSIQSGESQSIANTVQENRDPVLELEQSKYYYKGYKLEIIQDLNSPKVAPRRFAIAKDKRGIIVLKGQPSFSSSTDVLLDEIKFRIDNQLP
jgi:hypothetical protein